jgi:putative transposase
MNRAARASKATYSAKELAALGLECLPVTERGVTKKATAERWPAISEACRGGQVKKYLVRLLPEPIRIGIAAQVAAAHISSPAGPSGQAGADLAATMVKQHAMVAEQATIAKERGLAAYNALPPEKKAIADARYEVLTAKNAFLQAARVKVKAGTISFCSHYQHGSLKLPPAITAIIGNTLSWSTINRWQQAYEALGMIGLCPGYKNPKKGTTSLTAEMQTFAQSMLVDHPHLHLPTLMAGLKARFAGQHIPEEGVVRRYIKKWQAANASLLLYMRNPDEWKNKHMLAMGDAAAHIERLNQRWEFDSTPADVMLADGRYAIIGVIDVYSRRLLLHVAPTSRASAVAALTRRALIEWGVPEVAKTDNGADYVSDHMVRVFEGLGIEQKLCQPFTPWEKPHIERAFQTFSHSIVELLPGYIGHNVADRKAIEARRSFAARLMKQGGDPVDCTAMNSTQLQSLCDRWLAAVYEQNAHGGLDGQTPAEAARAWTAPIRTISDVRALDVLLSPAPVDGGKRTIGKNGIQVGNTFYIATEFAGHEGHKVQVLEDATDYGTIYVFLINDSGEREYLCTAVDPDRTGHNRAEIATRAKALQKQIVSDGSRELRKQAKKEATNTIHEEVLNHREALLANVVSLPQKTLEYTTRALEQAAQAVRDREAIVSGSIDQDRMIEAITIEQAAERVEVEQKRELGIVPIFTTATARYQYIRDRERKGGLSAVEIAFLNEFYESKIGGSFLLLEGDIRQQIGVDEAQEM